jgi:hypothetical protein
LQPLCKLAALLALATAVCTPALASTAALEIDPAVLSVSSGPWVWASGGYHFRAITVAGDGRVALHVQKVEIADDKETLSVVRTFPIDLSEVSRAVFEIGDIRWSSPDAFVFRVNSQFYAIHGLDGAYELRLAGPAPGR